jgi:UDP-N-acetylmuramoylalanine--D-glutamate ligase
MQNITNSSVLVVGLGNRGRAACELLRRQGARVTGLDHAETEALRAVAVEMRAAGVDVRLGENDAPNEPFDFAVVSCGVSLESPVVQSLRARGVRLVGELEHAYHQAKCLTIAVAGTNGKATTAGMIGGMLDRAGRRVVVAGHNAVPACAVVEQTPGLDYLVLSVNALQLQLAELVRPSIAVLLNLSPDFQDRFGSFEDLVRANARLFPAQERFEWAIVQSEALATLRRLQLLPRAAKLITFSATDSTADLHFDRGLLLSRLEDWTGPLLDMAQCRVRGAHNAENMMAALAVGRALRLPLETVVATLKEFTTAPHCFQAVTEADGVHYINDSKATNLAALEKALLSVPPAPGGRPNVWLIAGGVDCGQSFHDVSPLVARRVKGAFLVGEAAEKIRAAWSLFTPCTPVRSLLEAVSEAAKCASAGDVVLLSPACSSFDQFRNYQQRGESFCTAVKSISGGVSGGHPNRDGRTAVADGVTGQRASCRSL